MYVELAGGLEVVFTVTAIHIMLSPCDSDQRLLLISL